ncbi:MAG TPA: TolC family protein [Haliangiales bacterium]|nr:TolC family protein [Haliangiales bacterium]
MSASGWPGPARAERIDLATLLVRAKKNAQVEVARASADGAHAKEDEVSLSWTPHVEVTVAGGPSPEIRCSPSPEDCTATTPTETRIGFHGAFFRVDGTAYMPLYTFGKISSGTRAAEAGARAADALVGVAEAQAILDAARAFYGVKLAREILIMLDDGLEQLDGEISRVEAALAKGGGEVTESDRRRLRAVRAEVLSRISEARKGERIAEAGVRFFAGSDAAEADEQPLAAVEATLPTRDEARARALGRPEKRAADAAVVATGELVDVEKARWLPDIVAVAQGTFARSSSTDDPANAFYNDPFNVASVSAGVALRWTIDPAVRPAKIAQARAEEAKARATASLARTGMVVEAEKAWAEAADARDRLAAARAGEKEARAWMAATLQSLAAGLGEPRELTDALLLYFTTRARVLQATFDWNVGVIALQRAIGQTP